jgi:hypothetical protein
MVPLEGQVRSSKEPCYLNMAKLGALHLVTDRREIGLVGESPIRRVSVIGKVSFIYHYLNVDGLHKWKGVP